MDALRKDFRTSLAWGFVAFAFAGCSFYISISHQGTFIPLAFGSLFLLGGIALILMAFRRLHRFEELMKRAGKQDVWVSVHNSGSGNSSATSFFVKVYLSADAAKQEMIFETEESGLLRTVMENRLRVKATLLRHRSGRGTIILLYEGQTILPSSRVRYSG